MLPSKVGISFKDASSVYFLLQIGYRGWKSQESNSLFSSIYNFILTISRQHNDMVLWGHFKFTVP